MKILIVGFGNMGKSHYKSFFLSNKKYEISVVDKKFLKINKKNYKKKKIIFSNKIPTNKKFDLAIVATNSIERLLVINQILNFNKVKYLILEKFLFNFIGEYSILKKKLNNLNTKAMINVWGKFIYEPVSKIIKRKSINKIDIYCGQEILTNLIHYYDFIYSVIKKKFKLKLKLIKIIKSKRKGYSEIIGNLSTENKNYFPSINIKLNKNRNISHIFNLISNKKKIEIKIDKSGNCKYYLNKKIFKNIKFPYAYLNTEKFFLKDYQSKNKKYFSNLITLINLSKQILELIKKTTSKKIYIT